MGPKTCAEELAGEAGRYLEAVEEYRRQGCEPRWRTEASESQAPESSLGAGDYHSLPLRPILGS